MVNNFKTLNFTEVNYHIFHETKTIKNQNSFTFLFDQLQKLFLI